MSTEKEEFRTVKIMDTDRKFGNVVLIEKPYTHHFFSLPD